MLSSPCRHQRQRPQLTPGLTMTSSPTRTCSTSSPTAWTTPAISEPRILGSCKDGRGRPLRFHRSRWLSAHARTWTSTSSGRGAGSGTSSRRSTSGPPYSCTRTASISVPPSPAVADTTRGCCWDISRRGPALLSFCLHPRGQEVQFVKYTLGKGWAPMAARTKDDTLPQIMRQMETLAKSGQREQFAAYCRELLRQYGRDTEALMRLARFCQKHKWHGGFELFMLRLAERLPASRTGILVTLGEHLLNHGLHRGLAHVRAACAALVETALDKREPLLERAQAAAVGHLAQRDDWEEQVKKFPEAVRGDLY